MPADALRIARFCDLLTNRKAIADFPGADNGLQHRGKARVRKVGAAVDAGAKVFEMAAKRGVDFLIVHHGLFWDPARPLTGAAYERVATLVEGGCALYSSHLPLDAHPQLGNNALLARQVGLRPKRPFLVRDGEAIGCVADAKLERTELRRRLEAAYPRVVAIECGPARVGAVAFCSGSGNSAVPELGKAGADTLVTGELREEWFNRAQEEGLNLYCCGHYATEVHGVRALATELSRRFRLPWEFIGTDNPL